MDQHGFIEKQESNSTYRYIYSCDVDEASFRIKIGTLDGILPPHKNVLDQSVDEKITLSQSVHNNYEYIANDLNNFALVDEMLSFDEDEEEEKDDDDNNNNDNKDYIPLKNLHKEKLKETQKNKNELSKILFGSLKQPFRALSRHAYLTCDIVSNGTRLCPHQQIPYKEIFNRYDWNQWLVFPILLNTLPRDTVVCFTFWDTFETGNNIAVARTSISVFSKRGCLRKGLYDLRLFFNEDCEEYFKNLKENNINTNLTKNSYATFPDVEINDINFSNREHKNAELVRKEDEIIPKLKKHFNQTNESTKNSISVPDENFDPNSFEFFSTEQYYQNNLSHYPIGTLNKPKRIDQLTKMKKKYYNNQFPKLDWLDRLSFLKIEHLVVEDKTLSSNVYLTVEFPTVIIDGMEYAVVYYEDQVDESCQDDIIKNDIVFLRDPEINLPDLVEQKHHALARSARSGISTRDVKPNAAIRNHLNAIVNYPSTHQLTSEEQDLIWKYRFYLKNQKKALAKFLKIVNWNLPTEAEQAIDLMNEWQPMDIEDALELFSPFFTHPMVRKYAVCRLKTATDEDLLLYLLQLVQALKYENYYEILQMFELEFSNYQRNASNSTPIAKEIKMFSENTESVLETSTDTSRSMISTLNDSVKNDKSADIFSKNRLDSLVDNEDLATFLLNRTCDNDALANYFFWYLCIEFEGAKNAEFGNLSIDKILSPTYLASTMRYSLLSTKSDNLDLQKNKFNISEKSSSFSLNNTIEMYLIIMKRFSIRLLSGGAETIARRNFLLRQQDFVSKLVEIMKEIARESGNRLKKIEKLQSILESPEPQFRFNFNKNDSLPSPLNPDIKFIGVAYKEAMLYKSATMPAKLGFITTSGDIFYTIFKNGDDLRQDDLVLQMINLMDKLLRKENLDLKLTPYRVLACSSKHGFVEFIDSHSVAEVISNEGSIQNYLKKISQQCLPTVTTTSAIHDFQVVSTTQPKHSKRSSPSQQPTSGSNEISAEIMDAYVKSCAGYCVITYLLGIGDRHLDNLMLTKTGRLFHIDFGFILGRDPKVRPPAMKITREMVDAMGGMESENFLRFCSLVRTAFLHLRRHANLILNLFSLMVDANVPDIALEPDKTVQKVQDKFKLELDDEQAVHYIIEQVEQSVRSIMPVVVDQLHKMTQYLRN